MFILRKISGKGLESNIVIGDSYNIIHRESNTEDFRKTYKIVFLKDHVADNDSEADQFSKRCYAFIVYNKGSEIFPLYKTQWNYIMTCNGDTFANVSYDKHPERYAYEWTAD